MRHLFVPALLLIAACKKDEPPPAQVQQPALTGVNAKTKLGGASIDGAEYAVRLSAPDALTAGQAGAITISVSGKGTFHVNAEYPIAFKPEDAVGVSFAAERIKLEAGKKTPCEAKAEDACTVDYPLTVTPAQAGAATVAGKLAFSVCDPERCLIEKVPVSLVVNVR